jgi:eukaryotic-like serine/threonine-protein kinase
MTAPNAPTWICSRCRTRFRDPRERCPHDNRPVVLDLAGRMVADRYQVKELLGVGGMDSAVWLAWQTATHRPVAIKFMPARNDQSTDRFDRGARIASNLNHPHITIIHDYGTTEDALLYLVMEQLEGVSLQRALRSGPLGPRRTLHITDQVLRALDHAHQKGVVHRDVKPGNLFLCSRNDDADFVKVLDYGIARYLDDVEDPTGQGAEITMERQICGTPQYMAPEQVTYGVVDARVDLYALGVVMYRMLTGRLPFLGTSPRDLFRQHVQTPPPPFDDIRTDHGASAELEAAVMRALAKDPDDRYASAAEMRVALRPLRVQLGMAAGDLEDSLTESLVALGADEPPPARRGPLLWVGALALLAVGVAVGALAFRSSPPAGPTGAPAAPAAISPATPEPSSAEAPVPARAQDAAPPPAEDAAPPPVDASLTRQVNLTSTPTGAAVRLGDTQLGRTPLTVPLPLGVHTLQLALNGRQTTSVRVELTALSPATHQVPAVALAKAVRRPARPRPPKPAAATPRPPKPAAPAPAPPGQRVDLLGADELKAPGAAPKKPAKIKMLGD